MYVFTPLEYYLIKGYNTILRGGYGGTQYRATIIDIIALNSENPAFKTLRFRKALIEYRRFGLRSDNKAEWNLDDVLYFAKHSYGIHKRMKKGTE